MGLTGVFDVFLWKAFLAQRIKSRLQNKTKYVKPGSPGGPCDPAGPVFPGGPAGPGGPSNGPYKYNKTKITQLASLSPTNSKGKYWSASPAIPAAIFTDFNSNSNVCF